MQAIFGGPASACIHFCLHILEALERSMDRSEAGLWGKRFWKNNEIEMIHHSSNFNSKKLESEIQKKEDRPWYGGESLRLKIETADDGKRHQKAQCAFPALDVSTTKWR